MSSRRRVDCSSIFSGEQKKRRRIGTCRTRPSPRVPTYQTIRSDPGDGDDDVLAPTTLLRRGICRKGAPLKDALAALRRCCPWYVSAARATAATPTKEARTPRPEERRASRAACRGLARTPWLGAPLVAAAVLPRPPPVGAHVLEPIPRRHAAEVLGHPSQPAKLAAARAADVGGLLARFGAHERPCWMRATSRRWPRPCSDKIQGKKSCRPPASLIGALYAALVDAAAVARVSSGKDFSL